MKELELLGMTVRDKVTGLTGVVESVSYDLYGCIQAVVRPPANTEKGEIAEGRWFDVSRLAVTSRLPVMEIPGGRFEARPKETSHAPGPAEKPAAARR